MPNERQRQTPPERCLERFHLFEPMSPNPDHELTTDSSNAIWNVFQIERQKYDTFKKKMHEWNEIFGVIKTYMPPYGVYMIGSTLSGFGTETSDIDLCVIRRHMGPFNTRCDALTHLSGILDLLQYTCNIVDARLIRAKVPILRFVHVATNIEVDINFNNCVSVRNTHLLLCYSKLDWRVRPFGLMVKIWAKKNGINDAKRGTLSSYSLVLMAIHYLQNGTNPPVLPRLHELKPNIFNIMTSPDDMGHIDPLSFLPLLEYTSNNNQTLAELFIGFLKYYDRFE